MPFRLIVLVAAIIGYLGDRLDPGTFVIVGNHGAAKNSHGSVQTDDETPKAKALPALMANLFKAITQVRPRLSMLFIHEHASC
ncbi:hypothetical protein [Pseudomonas sp. GZD-209]|uniref:hypothetical protein n=1 Tax=Pseudomonas sp. GZD-209 TaxID=3404807 RepID=UPI003BB73A49